MNKFITLRIYCHIYIDLNIYCECLYNLYGAYLYLYPLSQNISKRIFNRASDQML